ncbi:MAG TPA: aminomethyl-transferring glycine dehydrogenase [Verrucomicrobiota bacterium]|nr:aminomethyl-transferring glycine dehydrogenase [Verrucomicrobiota bacterium]
MPDTMPSSSPTDSDSALPPADSFARRHIGPRPADIRQMLRDLNLASLEDLARAAVPEAIRLSAPPDLPPPLSETEALDRLREIALKNQVCRSLIGMGYADCITPAVIQRNVLENPGWYTQYTPYQAEISQGRLECLLNFQTMVSDLAGLPIANASLLDEATAAAEAMVMCHRLKAPTGRTLFLVAADCHPQTIEVVRTRAQPLGIDIEILPPDQMAPDARAFGLLLQYPATDGAVTDLGPILAKAHAAGALGVVATDLLSLVLLRPPGEFGADIAVGSAQRFGVPLGFGGPHAAFIATRDEFKRQMPGRLVGVSRDARGRPACRLALGTREQHIRREKATSNICTAQALLANMAALYAVYHGPDGLRRIAGRVHALAARLAAGLRRLQYQIRNHTFFDTLTVTVNPLERDAILEIANRHRINLRPAGPNTIGVTLDERSTPEEVARLLRIFHQDRDLSFDPATLSPLPGGFPPRTSEFLRHPVFTRYHSETEMLRYLRQLESRDLSLCQAMIPLGSCTMKLNATVEMLPISWPEFARVHPFAPPAQTGGYRTLFRQLERWLAAITGFAAVSLQPNAGSQGEYAGLLVIRRYHESRGEGHRRICLIPASAHGTNPASAVMAGLRPVGIACDAAGNVDLEDLQKKAAAHARELAALMVTYPSTHGVFEAAIAEACRIIHAHGGLVYLDGANMNAQVGLTHPAAIGADVCHLNLHKTFSIPHGGGGPGVGPICVAEPLTPFLPSHPLAPDSPSPTAVGPVSAAPWGSAGILPIPWVYIACMGAAGLTEATQVALLNANYIAHRLQPYYPVVYRGPGGWVAHECILDLRAFHSVTAEDVAKRLMDYGFHAPTLSWPVAGTLMVEPTESESKEELDRFCDAMIAIHAEIQAIETGRMDRLNNPLKNAPHTADMIADDAWDRPYGRRQAAFPTAHQHQFKFWPAVARVDNVYGDRNPVCTCAGMEAYDGANEAAAGKPG